MPDTAAGPCKAPGPGDTARTIRLALIALFLGTVLVSFSGTMVRLSEVGPLATAFWRMALAIPVMFVWMAIEARGAPRRSRHRATPADFALLSLAGLIFGVEIGIWHIAIGLTSVANATLFSNFSPIVVTLGAVLFLAQPTNRRFLMGMAIALAGAVVLMSRSVQISAEHAMGDLLALSVSVLFGVYVLIVAYLRARFGTATIMVWTCAWASLALLPVALGWEDVLLPPTRDGWLIVVFIAVACQGLGQSLLTQALAHLPAGFSSVGYLVIPALAATWAWIILGEAIGPEQAIGGAVILAGVILARRGSR
ncbi:MAG: DMT family transporter [Rhodospirillaceae bacterium]|nr:DMT family transporter [Rhodospirillaceae bacterium]